MRPGDAAHQASDAALHHQMPSLSLRLRTVRLPAWRWPPRCEGLSRHRVAACGPVAPTEKSRYNNVIRDTQISI